MPFKSVMLSYHLILYCPLLLLSSNLSPHIRVFSNESALHIRWPKYCSFSFNISPSNEGLPIRIDFLYVWLVWSPCRLRDSQESSSMPQSKSLSSLALSLLHGPTLTSVHDYWKNHSFDYMDLCWQSNISAF